MMNGRTELQILKGGTIIGDHYHQQVILSHERLFRSVIGADFVLWTAVPGHIGLLLLRSC